MAAQTWSTSSWETLFQVFQASWAALTTSRDSWMEARSLSSPIVHILPFQPDQDFRNETLPSTSSESMTAMMTASTGESLVILVWRAEEPAAVRTSSPMPASTVSTACLLYTSDAADE